VTNSGGASCRPLARGVRRGGRRERRLGARHHLRERAIGWLCKPTDGNESKASEVLKEREPAPATASGAKEWLLGCVSQRREGGSAGRGCKEEVKKEVEGRREKRRACGRAGVRAGVRAGRPAGGGRELPGGGRDGREGRRKGSNSCTCDRMGSKRGPSRSYKRAERGRERSKGGSRAKRKGREQRDRGIG
jgi:hypothetical protein